jgi:hypothetical protein
MRVLRQDPEECLFSFIASSNNNIGRIKGIVARCARAAPGRGARAARCGLGCAFGGGVPWLVPLWR